MLFNQLGLSAELLRAVDEKGYQEVTPIQQQAIPLILEGRDVLAAAQTGTGKTAGFTLPLLQKLQQSDKNSRNIRALVLTPTRELAAQVAQSVRDYGTHLPFKTAVIFGGVKINAQITKLRNGVDVVVATPGRLLDHMQQKTIDLSKVEFLVLDEADRMLDMGFIRDIRKVIKVLPKERQNLLFSATMPAEIRGLADGVLQDPHVVELNHSQPIATVEHALFPVDGTRKFELLERVLAEDRFVSAIVFTRTKHRAKKLARQLGTSGHRAVALQGNMSQSQRDRAMEGFRKERFDILVATDIAARGIDVKGISHVINFDVPNTPEAYTHRIGRTGRSELEGRAVTFVTRDDTAWLRATERMLGSPIQRHKVEGFEVETLEMGARGGRPSSGNNGRGRNGSSRSGDSARGRGQGRGRGRGQGRGSRSSARSRQS